MSRKPKSAEVIKEYLGHQLIYPCPTRWNSLYDSIGHLMKSKSKLNNLFDKLGKTNNFSAIELEYLEEFIEVLKPIATALDYLQGDNCYYGKLLPTLMSVRTRLDRLQGNSLRHFTVIVSQLKESLERRFDKFFKLSPEINEAILASCYHPSYKMRWFPESITTDERQRIQNLAIHALETNSKKHVMMHESSRSSTTSKEDDDFIVFVNRESDKPQTSKMELELVSFLNDRSKELTILERYPNIKNVFIQYNTSLCSSGPVERLFSLAGFIHSPTRGSLSDNTFKSLVFMKGNSRFTDQ